MLKSSYQPSRNQNVDLEASFGEPLIDSLTNDECLLNYKGHLESLQNIEHKSPYDLSEITRLERKIAILENPPGKKIPLSPLNVSIVKYQMGSEFVPSKAVSLGDSLLNGSIELFKAIVGPAGIGYSLVTLRKLTEKIASITGKNYTDYLPEAMANHSMEVHLNSENSWIIQYNIFLMTCLALNLTWTCVPIKVINHTAIKHQVENAYKILNRLFQLKLKTIPHQSGTLPEPDKKSHHALGITVAIGLLAAVYEAVSLFRPTKDNDTNENYWLTALIAANALLLIYLTTSIVYLTRATFLSEKTAKELLEMATGEDLSTKASESCWNCLISCLKNSEEPSSVTIEEMEEASQNDDSSCFPCFNGSKNNVEKEKLDCCAKLFGNKLPITEEDATNLVKDIPQKDILAAVDEFKKTYNKDAVKTIADAWSAKPQAGLPSGSNTHDSSDGEIQEDDDQEETKVYKKTAPIRRR